MTMPDERTRALRWAGEFLREVLQSAEYPAAITQQAKMILRRYPSAQDSVNEARFYPPTDFGPWLSPEEP